MTQDTFMQRQTPRALWVGFRIGALAFPLVLAGSLMAASALAHVTPLDIGDFNLGTAVTTTERNSAVEGDKGWIDGADGDWGDTHDTAAYIFSLVGEGSADVTLAVRGRTNALGGSGLSPGFTLYQGLPDAGNGDHDHSIGSELLRAADCAATPGCTTTEGSFRVMTNFRITNDADETGTSASVFTYVGHAYDGSVTLAGANSPLYDNQPYLVPNGDGTLDRAVSTTFHNLTAGDYTVFVGGMNYAAVGFPLRGTGLTLSVTPVPVPAAVWLFGSGLAGLVGLARRRMVMRS